MNYFIDQFGTLTPASFMLKGAGVTLNNIFTYPNPLKDKTGYGWRLVSGEPVQLIDKRGTLYNVGTGEPINWQELGEIPTGYTALKPEDGQVWNGSAWVDTAEQVLNKAYDKKLGELNALLTEKSSSFYSNVTGTTLRYSIDNEAQLNLTSVVLAGVDCPYICYKDDERITIPHTAEQLRALGLQVTAYKAELIGTHAALIKQLAQFKEAGNLTAIEAITWPNQ